LFITDLQSYNTAQLFIALVNFDIFANCMLHNLYHFVEHLVSDRQ